MGNLATTIPFTEMWERLLTMARIDTPNNEDFAKGMINDVYTRILPRIEDWDPIIKESTLTMTPYYNTGTVAVSSASTSVTGTGTTFTSVMTSANGYKIKFAGNDNIYAFSYNSSATTATIDPALSGTTDLSGASYEVFKDEYELASDFDRFLKNGSIYVYSGGRVSDTIMEYPRDKFREDSRVAASDPIDMAMQTRPHATTGNKRVKVNPPPKTAKVYPYEYVHKVTPMSDYAVGTVAVSSASTTVTGTGTSWAANVSAGDYFRLDGNGTGDSSKWYQIATVTDNTHIELSTAWAEDTESGGVYSISTIPSAFPSEFHEFLLYEALFIVVGEQGDPAIKGYAARREEIMKDLKKNYKSRKTNVQFGVYDGGYRDYGYR